MAHESRPNETNSNDSDGAPPSRSRNTAIEAERRQTAVRWLNRLYYDLAKWREEFVGLLRDYPGLRADATEADFDLFHSRLRGYEEDLGMRAPLSQPSHYGKYIGELCTRVEFLEARLFKDFMWLFDEDKTGFEELRDAVGRVQTNPFDFSTVAERAVRSFRPDIELSRASATSKKTSPKTIKQRINRYIEESNKPLQKIRGAAFKAGITLLTVEEYDKALHEEGSTNPNIVVLGEVTTYNVNRAGSVGPHSKAENVLNRGVIQMSGRDSFSNPGQAGIVGPHGHAHDMTFQQLSEAANKIDLKQLAADLAQLRAEMKKEPATTAEQDLAIGSVAAAESAASKGDGPGALQHLKAAGKWAFDVATKIGTGVAEAALKGVLGIPG